MLVNGCVNDGVCVGVYDVVCSGESDRGCDDVSGEGYCW